MSQLSLRRKPVLAATAGAVLSGALAMTLLTGQSQAGADEPAGSAAPPAGTAVAELPGSADGYYDDAIGLTGDQLKTALHEIISEAEQLSYSQVWDALKDLDQDPDNPGNVLLLYSGESRSADRNGGNVGDWNREHVWPQSRGDFGTAPGPGTDLHHLKPTDVQVNSERGNKDFDEGGEEVERAPGNFTDEDSWEPRDAVKGDVARMVLYMAVRYEGTDQFEDLEVTEEVGRGGAPLLGRLSQLVEWHEADPPDAAEQARNQRIYDEYQGNRNPFVDHPEWVAEIWG